MDAIDRAIDNQKLSTSVSFFYDQTWDEFSRVSCDCDVYLFGLGAFAEYYWRRITEAKPLHGVIDNNIENQGVRVDKCLWCGGDHLQNLPVVTGIDGIMNRDPQNTVVVINSINYFEQIYDQLLKMGFSKLFVLALMEADYRRKHALTGESYEEFSQKCMENCIKRGKILFIGFGSYSGHGKYITEALLKLKYTGSIVWMIDKDMDKDIPQDISCFYRNNTKRYLYELESAEIVIFDTILPDWAVKKNGQIYIHTKHWASVTLKRFYLDASTIMDIPGRREYIRNKFSCLDYVITGSEFDEKSCERGFDFHGNFIRAGSPRSDAMFRYNEARKKVLGGFDILKHKHLLTYAPTYRYDRDETGEYIPVSRGIDLNYANVKAALEKRFGGKWVILLRLHPSVAQYATTVETEDYLIDASGYPDGEELVAASDVLISDYSSIMFEPAFVKRPVFLYATDRETYIGKEYDLLIDYDTLPFPIAESDEQLIDNIHSFDNKRYETDVEVFLNRYGVHEDGHAAERAAGSIMNLLSGLHGSNTEKSPERNR